MRFLLVFVMRCVQVVLELRNDGLVVTSDDPPVILGTLAPEFLEQVNPCLLF